MRIARFMGPLLCALAFPTLTAAQTAKPKISFGVLGALNLATLTGGDVPGKANLVAYSAGAFVRVPFDAAWSLQTGLEYAVKGQKATDNTGSAPVTMKLELKYIEIPVLLHVATTDNPSFKLYGEAGPAFSFKESCSVSGATQGVTVSASCTEFGTLRSYDIGAMVGAGVEIPIGAQAILVGARYNAGLVAISEGDTEKNRVLQFLIGLKF